MLQSKDMAEWIQKQDLYVYCLKDTHFRSTDTYRLKVRGWKKVFPANWKSKESWSKYIFFISEKNRLKTVTRDKEGHYKIIKGSIKEEDITILNICAPNTRTLYTNEHKGRNRQ